jgi:hypothetical protein
MVSYLMNFLSKEKLIQVLMTNWTEFINRSELVRFTLEKARDTPYPVMEDKEMSPAKQVKISITDFDLDAMELWIEFTIPKANGTAIGTHICTFSFSGEINLKESLGTLFVSQKS